MTHLPILPVLVPACAAALLLVLHRTPLRVSRIISVVATSCFALAAVALFARAGGAEPLVYTLGDWRAPLGIVMVADRLSALMVLLTALLAAAVLTYALHGWDARGRMFHIFLQLQLMGLSGAFLTGDLFNLFVFFEVTLIASYCLLLQGLGQARLRAAFHYVAINLTASGVFLISVSLLYGITGTLNMAHLAARMGEIPAGDIALARTAGLLLVGVFSVKAALFPLHFWLPAAYASAAAPVAALFAIMTKLGVYSIIRVTTGIYAPATAAAADLTSPWLLPLALTTLVAGTLGALGAQRLAAMTAYLTIASVGTMLTAVSTGGTAGLAAALYYLVHSTLAVALLFLIADLLGRQRGALADALRAGPRLLRSGVLGVAFLFAAATIVGLPPSTGFLGKIMVLRSVLDSANAAAIWTVVLGTSLLMLVGCARAGSVVLWKSADAQMATTGAPRAGEWLALVMLAASSLLLVIFADPALQYVSDTAEQLASPAAYIDAVLGPDRDGLIRTLPSGPAQ